jgi:predicted enzyme related to lactoylglutathione lyase
MISGGNATLFVSNMDRSVRFYTQALGLRLVERYGDDWATVDAGKGLTIGLHPASAKYPAPGTKGGIMLGFQLDESLEAAVATIREAGVHVADSIEATEAGRFAHLEDPDGNVIYLWELPVHSHPS